MPARASVSAEPNPRTGKVRLRCDDCGKVAFATEERADAAAGRIWTEAGQAMDVYFGPACGWYHLTRAER